MTNHIKIRIETILHNGGKKNTNLKTNMTDN
jgi:hypothetical protein